MTSPATDRRRRRGIVLLAVVLCGAALAAGLAEVGRGEKDKKHVSRAGKVVRDTEEAQSYPEPDSGGPHPKADSPAVFAEETPEEGISPGAPSDEEVRRDLRQLERYYGRGSGHGGGSVTVANGLAQAAPDVPDPIVQVIAGGNAIARFPYRWGGGHGSFLDDAYDCSGSVSYALAAGGMLDAPLASGELMDWGEPGHGRWITVYANPGHVYMEVGGVRFDTSGRAGRRGSRWQLLARAGRGFEPRHWPGF